MEFIEVYWKGSREGEEGEAKREGETGVGGPCLLKGPLHLRTVRELLAIMQRGAMFPRGKAKVCQDTNSYCLCTK